MTRSQISAMLLIGALSAGGAWALVVEDEFPHDDHAGLFPLCSGCHIGIETGVEDDVYPDAESCALSIDEESQRAA